VFKGFKRAKTDIMNKGIPIIKKFEGLKLKAYLCPAGLPTIGYGNTRYEDGSTVKLGEQISIDRADRLLMHTVAQFERQVDTLVTAPINANQLGALTSFAFNVGIGNFQRSTLRKMVIANPSNAAIRAEFMKWNKAGGKVLNGLTRRRQAEADLYFTQIQ
jgi:lysozyme